MSTGDYWLDVETFETATTQYGTLADRDLTPDQVTELERAIDVYVGDLLEGTYEEWVLYDRERLRLAYIGSLNKLLVYHGLQGNYEQGLEFGQRLLACDNTREKVHRQMMWLHCLSGNRAGALAQYRLCSQLLREELGVRPMAETRQLYQQMKRESFNPKCWPADWMSPSSDKRLAAQTLHPLAKHALQRLHHLQEIIEDSSAELRLVEHLVTEAFAQPQQGEKSQDAGAMH
jgi:DNA-binding SARP family transcriptional activator